MQLLPSEPAQKSRSVSQIEIALNSGDEVQRGGTRRHLPPSSGKQRNANTIAGPRLKQSAVTSRERSSAPKKRGHHN